MFPRRPLSTIGDGCVSQIEHGGGVTPLAADAYDCGMATPAGAPRELAPCPRTPNCVSSRHHDPARRLPPFPVRGTAAEAMDRIERLVRAEPGARVVVREPGYLRAEFRTRVFRFVDDVELVVDEGAGVIHFRSASRLGRRDFGVNRRRMERIAARYAAAG